FVALMAIIWAGAFVTSGFGIGGGVLVTPLFISVLPPKYGIGLLAPLMLLMSGAGVRQYWRLWDNRHILILLPASLVGIWLGSYLLSEVPSFVVRKTVGVLAVIFGGFQFFTVNRPEWRNRLRPPAWQGVGFGFASGITSALAHTGGIVFSFYLLPHSRTKEAFVATTVFLFFIGGLVKMGTYWYYDLLTVPILLLSLVLVPALILGSILGKRLNRRIPNRLFLILISLFIALMGIRLMTS
ncbi:MAG: hypothetical protein H6Q42_4278, partial [Deltaproteobacteria bacterium]|nr:hypothetical protein [Deltaproteobacteria bacterium]